MSSQIEKAESFWPRNREWCNHNFQLQKLMLWVSIWGKKLTHSVSGLFF